MSNVGRVVDADAAIRGFCQAGPIRIMHPDGRVESLPPRLAVMAQPLQHQAPWLNDARVADAQESSPADAEIETLRAQLAAANAQIAALTHPEPAPLPNPMTRAMNRWPGSVGFMQGLRWRGV